MKNSLLEEAATQAVRDIGRQMKDVDIGPPPGAEPIPWRDQAAQFIADIPDLLTSGPTSQQIVADHGQDALNEYLATMGRDILQRGRQRRAPL